jgi:hypothetical protein
MKTQAAVGRSKASRSARAPAPALKVPRPAASAHEREAADSASRFLRGESGLRTNLNPAPAAHWALPASSPRGLPTGLRTQLEMAFDADLGALRLYADAPAHASAAAFGARAFTAGSAIFFAEGAWSPDSPAGRELIAHEVAHALQQTGRVSHGGRWRLEPLAWGEAGVQRDPDHNEDVRAAKAKLGSGLEIAAKFKTLGFMQPRTDSAECKAVVERHLQLPEDTKVKALGEQIKKAVDGKSVADAVTAVDLVFSIVSDADKTDRVNALFFDAYKSLNADAKAGAVVGDTLPEQTAFGSWSFYKSQLRGNSSWVTALLKKHPVASKYWPNMVVAVARLDFYGLTRGGLNLDPQMKFNDTMGDAIVDALLYQPTMPDERMVVALRALVGFDVIRLKPFSELATAIKDEKTLIGRMEVKLQLIERYKDPKYLARVAFDNKAEDEVFRIAWEAGALIAPIAERALKYWQSIQRLGQVVLVSEKADAAAKAQGERFKTVLRRRLPSLKPLAGLEKKILPILTQALQLQAGGVPTPATMAAAFAVAAKRVENLVFQLDVAIANRDKKLQTGKLPGPSQDPNADVETEPTAEESEAVTDDMVYGVVLYLLFALQKMLVGYKAPPKGKDEAQRVQDQDAAVQRFKLIARGFGNLADMLGYQTLSQAAWEAFLAEQGGLKKSYVGLLAPFEKLPPTPLAEFGKDFPKGDIANNVLAGTTLIQTVFALYYENFLTKLSAELKALVVPGGTTREFDYDLNKKAIVNAALDAANKAFHLPRKYRVPKDATVLYVRPGQDRERVYDFVAPRNPYVLQLVADEKAENETALAPGNFRAHQEGFVVWILPDMDMVINKIKDVPGIDQIKKKDGKPLGKPEDYATPMQWLDELDMAASKDAAVRAQLADTIKAWMTKAYHDLDAPLRRATNNERWKVRPLVAAQWEKLTKSFLESPSTFFEAPRRALASMLTFVGNIQPVTVSEQKLQMAGLMLELAPVLSRKLGQTTTFGGLVSISGSDRLDIVLPLHAHLDGAAKLAADSANLADLRALNLAFPLSELADRTVKLKALAEDFRSTAESAKAQRLMQGVAADRMLRVPDRGHALTAKKDDNDQDAEDMFQVEGVVYKLLKVHHDFTYEPELLSMASGIQWSSDDISTRRLWVDGVEQKPDAAEVPLLTIMRTPNGGDPKEIVVTSSNTALLSELTYALDLHITLENLETLATILEGYASVLTTAIQLAFPEFATEIAAAEVAGSVIQFLGSPEFAMLKASLDSDAGGLFDQGLKKITDQFTLDALWDYLLFDVKPPIFATLGQALDPFGRMGLFQRNKKNSDTTQGTVRRVFGRLIRIAGELVSGFEDVHDDVSFPFRKVSLYVQGSPWLSLLMRFVANNLYRLEGMTLRELGVDQVVDMISEVQQMYLRFETVVKGLGEYELPDELVPIPAILDMLVNFLIDRLPLKYRLIVREGKTQLQPLISWLEEKAGKALKDNGIDPNRIWRDYTAKKINPYIQSAGKEVSKEIEGVLNKVSFLHDLATIDVPTVATKFVDREVEPAPKLAAGLTAPRAAPSLPQGAGAPMGVSMRAQAQRGFGHDFSHVRMHRGDAVDSSLRASGAQAATAGSHVYLDSGISTSTPGGRDVLHHELAHVLQQTGARPLGNAHSDTPVRSSARSDSGWAIDPSAESQADRLAHSARTPTDSPRPFSAASGLQPSLYDVVAKMFVELGDATKLQTNAKQMQQRQVKDKELEQAAPGLKGHFAAKLFAAMIRPDKPGSVVSYVSPFDAAGDDLLEYVQKNRQKDVEAGLPHVLSAGIDTIKPSGKDPFSILVPGRVETALEEFFFGVTGVSVDIEFHTKKQPGPDGKERTAIDVDNPFKTIKFNYVHLPMVGGGAKIWSDIIANTFPTAGAKASLYQANARLALQGLKPGPGLFTTGKGKLGKSLIFARKTRELIEAYVNPPPKRDLPGDAVPKWSDYIKPDSQPPTTAKDYGQVGLRLGFYKDRENLRAQKGTDRASHHTVQYLLLEYLLNSKDRVKPFPNDLSLYPNLKATGQRVDVIAKAPGADAGIKISANEDDRGGAMPTILLSVHTHTLGNVHITPKADDVEGTPPSQGSAIHGEFRKFLGEYGSIVQGKAGPLTAMAKKAAGKVEGKDYKASDIPKVAGGTKEATLEDMSAAIFNASCKTYTWMREHMNTKLERAIDDQESFYYNKLVETATNTSIYNKNLREAQPGYVPEPAGSKITTEVLKRQIAIFQSSAFGFEEMH